jgi:DICT domain-containing protein
MVSAFSFLCTPIIKFSGKINNDRFVVVQFVYPRWLMKTWSEVSHAITVSIEGVWTLGIRDIITAARCVIEHIIRYSPNL